MENFRVQKFTSVSDAIADLPMIDNGDQYNGFYEPKMNKYIEYLRRYMDNYDIYDHFCTKHKDYVIERYEKIKQGENWQSIRHLMTNYTDVNKTHSNIYRRLSSDTYAYTIIHYRKSMIIHPTQNRGLSFREACRLQSFPDWFRFMGKKDSMQQQLANAVPPLLASHVAYAIAEICSSISL